MKKKLAFSVLLVMIPLFSFACLGAEDPMQNRLEEEGLFRDDWWQREEDRNRIDVYDNIQSI
jgi:hypothetical protein